MGKPAPELPADNFSARWTGKLTPTISGKYRFGAIADDGVRIYLDGKLIAEDWTEHAPTTVTAEVTLEAGKSYKVAGWASVNEQKGMPVWDVLARHLRSGKTSDRRGDGVTLKGVDDNPGIAGQG